MKNVLHIGFTAPSFLNGGWQNAFKENGFSEYNFLDWHKLKFNCGVQGAWQRIFHNCENLKPDLIFLQINVDGFIYPEEAKRLSEFGKVILYVIDARNQIDWVEDIAPHIDLLALSNQEDVNYLRDKWYKSSYVVQSTCDTSFYRKMDDCETKFDIVFVGNNFYDTNTDYKCSAERLTMYNTLRGEFPDQFKCFGRNWINSKIVGINDELQIYNSCKIAINHNNFDRELYTSDRIWRAMACGAFMLTKYFKGIETMFEKAVDLDWWHTVDELQMKIKFYLHHETYRHEIAARGMATVRERHSPRERIKEMMILLESNLNMWVVPKKTNVPVFSQPYFVSGGNI